MELFQTNEGFTVFYNYEVHEFKTLDAMLEFIRKCYG